MNVNHSVNQLCSLDYIQLYTGEILTICGNYDGQLLRTRLSFYPDKQGDKLIDHRLYQKVRYESNFLIPKCEKVLNLPGEQHYLVNCGLVARVYRAKDAFVSLPDEYATKCQQFIDYLYATCQYDKDAHGLTGSGALGCLQPMSDFDWVLYSHDPTLVEACVRSSAECNPEFTFAMEHVYRKYSAFRGLCKEDLDKLFAHRWRYFRYKGMKISINIVDPIRKADLYSRQYDKGSRTVIRGEVINGLGCYHFPYIIPIQCNGEIRNVLSWLFLYNGAFAKGDSVEISGRVCTVHGQHYVLVEEHDDYIRKLSNEKG
jgi:predicted nucleotidyltransferase